MANEQQLTIALSEIKAEKESIELEKAQLEALEEVSDILSKDRSEALAKRKKLFSLEEKERRRNEHIYKLQLMGEFSPAEAKRQKIKNKLLTKYNKYIVQSNLFGKMLESFKNIAKQSESFFMKIVKFLLFFAIFDPQGTLLTSLINMVIQIGTMLIKMLMKWIPILVKRIFNLFWNVLLPGVGRLASAFLEALGFKQGGVIATLGGFLAKFAFLTVMILGAWGKFGKFIIPMVKGLRWIFNNTVKRFLFTKKVEIEKTAMKKKSWVLEKARAAWTFTQEKAKWLWEKKKWLWEKAKMALELVMNPVFLIIAAIVAVGVLIWKFRKQIIGFFKFIGKHIMEFFEPVIKFFKFMGKKIIEFLQPVIDFLKPIFKALGTMASKIKTVLVDGVVGAFKKVKKIMSDLIIWFTTIGRVGIFDYATATDKEQARMQKLVELGKKTTSVLKRGGKVDFETIKLSKMSLKGDSLEKAGKMKNLTQANLNKKLERLERTIANLDKAEEKRKDSTDKNSDELKKNSGEIEKDREERQRDAASKQAEGKILEQFKKFDFPGNGATDLAGRIGKLAF